MRKIIGLFLFIGFIAVVFPACNKSVSYAERVETEKKRIKNFLAEQNIEVLSNYPSNGVFKSNQFYLDPSGVYINVVDSGNGKRATALGKVYYRFSEAMELPTAEADTVNLVDITPQPLEFQYGIEQTYTSQNSNSPAYAFLCPGIVTPLKYVGENAVVRLLVPFKSGVGSIYQGGSFATIYYHRVKYTQIIN